MRLCKKLQQIWVTNSVWLSKYDFLFKDREALLLGISEGLALFQSFLPWSHFHAKKHLVERVPMSARYIQMCFDFSAEHLIDVKLKPMWYLLLIVNFVSNLWLNCGMPRYLVRHLSWVCLLGCFWKRLIFNLIGWINLIDFPIIYMGIA